MIMIFLNCYIHTNWIQPLDDGEAIGNNQCLYLPKAELNTKNSTKRQLCFRLLKLVVFKSIKLEKSVSVYVEKRVTLIPTFLITYGKPKIPHESTKNIGVTNALLTLHRSPLVGGWI